MNKWHTNFLNHDAEQVIPYYKIVFNCVYYDSCTYRDGVIPCNPLLPTLKTVSAPEEDKIEELSTCFPTNCACRKSERYLSQVDCIDLNSVMTMININRLFAALPMCYIIQLFNV